MNEEEWLASTELRRMLRFVRPQATLRKMLAFATACDQFIPRSPDDQMGEDDTLTDVAPVAMQWGPNYLINSLLSTIIRQVRVHGDEDNRGIPAALKGNGMSALCDLLRDQYSPFRSVTVSPHWFAANEGTVRKLTAVIFDEGAYHLLPILGDALEEAGCADTDILSHCREPRAHLRGCWVIDLLVGTR